MTRLLRGAALAAALVLAATTLTGCDLVVLPSGCVRIHPNAITGTWYSQSYEGHPVTDGYWMDAQYSPDRFIGFAIYALYPPYSYIYHGPAGPEDGWAEFEQSRRCAQTEGASPT